MVVQQGDTYSAQGLFDPFWGVKRNGSTPEDFRQFNSATALLLKTDPETRIAVSGDAVKATFWITHYGEAPLAGARVKWALRSGDAVLAQGECDGGDVELGSTRLFAETSITMPNVAKPLHAVLEVAVAHAPVCAQHLGL